MSDKEYKPLDWRWLLFIAFVLANGVYKYWVYIGH